MERFLWICFGGACGTGARYLLSGLVLHRLGSGFPFGTLAVNVLGSFLIGVLMHVGLTMETIPPSLRLALGIGVLGGFTTFSTFSYETVRLLEEGAFLLALANVATSLLGGLAACFLGLVTARTLVGN
ncbi:MAG: fluoride efflux transporter CrcB [Planctomycetota bacterium]